MTCDVADECASQCDLCGASYCRDEHDTCPHRHASHCGRIDDHPAHEWIGRHAPDFWHRVYECSGRVQTEGGEKGDAA